MGKLTVASEKVEDAGDDHRGQGLAEDEVGQLVAGQAGCGGAHARVVAAAGLGRRRTGLGQGRRRAVGDLVGRAGAEDRAQPSGAAAAGPLAGRVVERRGAQGVVARVGFDPPPHLDVWFWLESWWGFGNGE